MRVLQAAGGAALTVLERAPGVLSARASWTIALSIAAVGYGLDYLTKELALAHLDPENPPVLLGGLLTLRLVHNPGAAFSMGENFTAVFTVIAIIAFGAVLFGMLPRTRHRGWAIGLGLLLAGILGNLTDRLIRPPGFMRGYVVDFLQLPHFAVFNVADMCITFAAITIVWLVVVRGVDLSGAPAKDAPRPGDGGDPA